GDYFDIRMVSEDVWSAVVADVSGKGVSSALLAGFLQGAFQMTSGTPDSLQPMVQHMNQFLLERTGGEKYATLVYLILNRNGDMDHLNAGHCSPYIVGQDGTLKRLEATGMPVGMLDAAVFETFRIKLTAGDKLVIYSDGLTEAANAEGQF